MILPYKGTHPRISHSAYISTGVVITGDVSVGERSNIWYNTVIRGDVAPTMIGNEVSIQDNSTLHQTPNMPLIIEDGASVGHNAVLHSCHVKKNALIGMGAIVLDGAEIGEGSIVGAGTLVPPGKIIPPNCLAIGSPAKVVRELNDHDRSEIVRIRETYTKKGQYYKELEGEHAKELKQEL